MMIQSFLKEGFIEDMVLSPVSKLIGKGVRLFGKSG